MSEINGATCNGRNGRGCGRTERTIKVGSNPFWVAVDQASDTVYIANYNDETVSVINGARCNGRAASGCRRTQPTGSNTAMCQLWI